MKTKKMEMASDSLCDQKSWMRTRTRMRMRMRMRRRRRRKRKRKEQMQKMRRYDPSGKWVVSCYFSDGNNGNEIVFLLHYMRRVVEKITEIVRVSCGS